LNRLFLGSARYPTRTRIESLAIGGTSIDLRPGPRAEVKSPLGRGVGFAVGVGGARPRLVTLRLRSVATGNTTEIELLPEAAGTADPGSSPPAAASAASFTARLPKLAESVDLEVVAGDAWTDPVRLTGIPPPLIDLALTATPPAYARGGSERPVTGARQVTVLEGSEVGIAVRCTNKKLASATLLVDGVEHPLRPDRATAAAPGGSADWEIAAAESPLARLEKTVAFELRVVDEDGLGADMPIVGSIRVKPDAPPRVTADVQTRLVLPTASPRLTWRVADDQALASVVVVAEAVAAGADSESQDPEQRPRAITIPVPLPTGAAGWVGGERLPLEGSVPVKLEPLGLAAGDQVRLTVRAADYRGAAAGQETESEPIMLEVTDERGILAALTETDERSVGQIDAIIDRELMVGGGR